MYNFSARKNPSETDQVSHYIPRYSLMLRHSPTKNIPVDSLQLALQDNTISDPHRHMSSTIPPLLHPLPTSISLKFCDQICPVRRQTCNLSFKFGMFPTTPPKIQNAVEKRYICTNIKKKLSLTKLVTLRLHVLYHTPSTRRAFSMR